VIEEEPGKQMIEKPRCVVCRHREDVHYDKGCRMVVERHLNKADVLCPCPYYSPVKS